MKTPLQIIDEVRPASVVRCELCNRNPGIRYAICKTNPPLRLVCGDCLPETSPEEAEGWLRRPCVQCKAELPADWHYALCEACGNAGCPHGNPWDACNRCAVESDLAFDAWRESR